MIFILSHNDYEYDEVLAVRVYSDCIECSNNIYSDKIFTTVKFFYNFFDQRKKVAVSFYYNIELLIINTEL